MRASLQFLQLWVSAGDIIGLVPLIGQDKRYLSIKARTQKAAQGPDPHIAVRIFPLCCLRDKEAGEETFWRKIK